MEQISKAKSISIWIFIIPFITINACLLLITQFQSLFPNQEDIIHNTFPYLDGGASISRTARPYPSWLIFKPGMFLTSYLLIKYWIYNRNIIKFFNQDHSKATYAQKIGKIEGKINWNDKALCILGKINGLFPTPGAFFNFNGERYKILKAEIGNGLGEIGEVLSDKLEIACGNNNSIKILEIQRQGKKPQKIGEFMLGSQIKKGSILSNV